MIVSEQVTDKLQKLPAAAQEEVLDFVEFLLEKSSRQENLSERIKQFDGEEKARAIERWAKSHSLETPVIINDSREIIYEN